MTKQDFISYLSAPENLNGHSIASLEKLVEEYPYFQTGRMLYLKNLYNQNSIDYEKNLHITSAYAPSGKVLYNLIKKKSQVSSLKSKVEEIKVDSKQYAVDKEQPKEVLPNMEAITVLQEMPIIPKEETQDEYDELQLLEKEMLREAYRTSLTIDLLDEKKELDINQELETKSSGSYSFNDWLKVMSGKTSDSSVEEKAIQRKQRTHLVDQFLLDQTAKSSSKAKIEFYTAEGMAKKSIQDDETFVSETLASIYLRQGNLPKALRAYEILLVKHPEKIHIFAPILEKIKKLLEDQKNR